MSHTPGEWTATEKLSGSENHRGWALWATVTGEDGEPFRCWLGDISPLIEDDSGNPSTQGQANARLISAAPDLLESLKAVVGLSDRKHNAWDKAHAAIAKAEGVA